MLKRRVSGAMLTLLLIGMLALATSIQTAKTELNIMVVPDDSPTIQEAINNAVDGGTIFVRTGTYYEHVVVNKPVSLVGEDSSTTIIDGSGTGRVIDIISNNVNVTGFTVQKGGSIALPDLDAGICLDTTTDCFILENRLVDNGFAGISILNSQRNTIAGNNVTGTGWGGIHLFSSSYNTISKNALHSNVYLGINGHASSHYNNITENVISNSVYGMVYHNANYNNISRNNISNIAVEGIWLQDQVSYNVVTENNLINNTVAIRVQGPNYNNTLSKNVITGAEYGIEIQDSARYTRIADNVIVNNRAGSDSWRAGIRLDSAMDSQIYSNIIRGNHYGILLYSYSPRVSVYGNSITDNEYGLRVASGGSNYLNVSDNIVMNNQGYGIGVTGFGGASNYAAISRNLIVNNSDGIALGQYSNYNTILQNNIKGNGFGFYIEYSTQNTIWRNNVVDNDQQVYVSTGSVNIWDNGYPSGGNYWSDYAGVDFKNGPDQDLLGSDGIGDMPYVIAANNRDQYPIMNPLPALSVEPKTYKASRVGEVFNVSITINDLVVGWRMSYVEFKLNYNDTVLDVLNVADGGFMKHFAEQYPQMPELHTWPPYRFMYFVEPRYVIVGVVIIHPPIWMRIYPEGSGTLVTITFKAAVGQEAQYDLELVDTLLVDESFNEIPHNTEDGYYTWSPTHDIAMVSVEPSISEAYIGQAVNISVVVKNEGTTAEDFPVTCKYELEGVEHVVGTQTVTNLAPNTTASLTFTWATTDITIHNLKAELSPLQGEIDIADNTMTSPITVKVKLLGDVNDDNKVDIKDIAQAAQSFGSYQGYPRWAVQADVNQDGRVDIRDIALIAIDFGKTYP